MKRSTLAVRCLAGAGAIAAVAILVGGPIQPPEGPVQPTGVTLERLSYLLPHGGLDPQVGYKVAGIPTDGFNGGLQTVVSGESGVIKQIHVSFEDNNYISRGVELYVDGVFAGHFRPTVREGGGSVAYMPSYGLNIAFTSTVQLKAESTTTRLSASVHYLPAK